MFEPGIVSFMTTNQLQPPPNDLDLIALESDDPDLTVTEFQPTGQPPKLVPRPGQRGRYVFDSFDCEIADTTNRLALFISFVIADKVYISAFQARAAQGQLLGTQDVRTLPWTVYKDTALDFQCFELKGKSRVAHAVTRPRGWILSEGHLLHAKMLESHYRQVADIYRRARAANQYPTQAVQKELEVSYAEARRQVLAARKSGYLEPAPRGRPRADGLVPGSREAQLVDAERRRQR
jgi:hypothetical protein